MSLLYVEEYKYFTEVLTAVSKGRQPEEPSQMSLGRLTEVDFYTKLHIPFARREKALQLLDAICVGAFSHAFLKNPRNLSQDLPEGLAVQLSTTAVSDTVASMKHVQLLLKEDTAHLNRPASVVRQEAIDHFKKMEANSSLVRVRIFEVDARKYDLRIAKKRKYVILHDLAKGTYPTQKAAAKVYGIHHARIGQCLDKQVRMWNHPCRYGSYIRLKRLLNSSQFVVSIADFENLSRNGNPIFVDHGPMKVQEALNTMERFLASLGTTLMA